MLARFPALLAVLAVFAISGCSSAGPYGYSRSYSAADGEDDAVENAREYDPIMVQRDLDDWKKGKVWLFGVVASRKEGPAGSAYLTLSMRTLAERNLCDDFDEETCRVTVSEKEHAIVHVLTKLASTDNIGTNSMAAGSLVRIVGKVSDNVDPEDGMPVLEVSYYRHWPRNYFVTTAASTHMKR